MKKITSIITAVIVVLYIFFPDLLPGPLDDIAVALIGALINKKLLTNGEVKEDKVMKSVE